MQYLLGIMMFLTALFLILLVLIQRGRGGGLAGAFGGAGGQSAFGTKAGDMFTKITIGTAALWIVLNAFSVWMLNSPESSVLGSGRKSSGDSQINSTDDSKLGQDGGGLDGTGTETEDGGETDGGETDGAATDGEETTAEGTESAPVSGDEPETTSNEDQPDGGAANSVANPSSAEPTPTPSTVPPPGE